MKCSYAFHMIGDFAKSSKDGATIGMRWFLE